MTKTQRLIVAGLVIGLSIWLLTEVAENYGPRPAPVKVKKEAGRHEPLPGELRSLR